MPDFFAVDDDGTIWRLNGPIMYFGSSEVQRHFCFDSGDMEAIDESEAIALNGGRFYTVAISRRGFLVDDDRRQKSTLSLKGHFRPISGPDALAWLHMHHGRIPPQAIAAFDALATTSTHNNTHKATASTDGPADAPTSTQASTQKAISTDGAPEVTAKRAKPDGRPPEYDAEADRRDAKKWRERDRRKFPTRESWEKAKGMEEGDVKRLLARVNSRKEKSIA